ncbi:hypothetical protein B9Q23_03785 [Enterobacter kobei]|nr:hypothetical protein B9Q23_03785 [Enterobacter kobei]
MNELILIKSAQWALFLFQSLAKLIQKANRVFLFNCELSKMNPMKNAFFYIAFYSKRADSMLL